MSKVIIGVDLGGTNVKTAIVSEDKKIIAKESRPTQAEEGPVAIMDLMAQCVTDLMGANGLEMSQALAAGFGAPGPMNWQTGIVFEPRICPAGKRAACGRDAETPADPVMWTTMRMWPVTASTGSARAKARSIVVFTLGTGWRGIVVFGQLLRGIDGTAAELGHITVQRDGRPAAAGRVVVSRPMHQSPA